MQRHMHTHAHMRRVVMASLAMAPSSPQAACTGTSPRPPSPSAVVMMAHPRVIHPAPVLAAATPLFRAQQQSTAVTHPTHHLLALVTWAPGSPAQQYEGLVPLQQLHHRLSFSKGVYALSAANLASGAKKAIVASAAQFLHATGRAWNAVPPRDGPAWDEVLTFIEPVVAPVFDVDELVAPQRTWASVEALVLAEQPGHALLGVVWQRAGEAMQTYRGIVPHELLASAHGMCAGQPRVCLIRGAHTAEGWWGFYSAESQRDAVFVTGLESDNWRRHRPCIKQTIAAFPLDQQ